MGPLGAGVAAVMLVAGTIIAFGAPEGVVGTTPTAAGASCQDTWTGAARTTDWNTATNWSTGVPDSADVHVCITGNAPVVLAGGSLTVGELTILAGSSLTIGTGVSSATAASLHVSSGLENDGTLSLPSSRADDELTLDGSVSNMGTLVVGGTVTLGDAAASSLTNDGTIGIAPRGLLTMGASSTIANESDGLLAFGVNGPPTSASDYGRITNGTLSLAGTVDQVFDDGFTPAPDSEYAVVSGAWSGDFTKVLNGAKADYAHPGEIGLSGGASAVVTSASLTSSAPSGAPFGQAVQLTAAVTPLTGSGPSGFVTFSTGGLVLGNAPLTTDGGVTTAVLDVPSLPLGASPVTARYDGDVRFDASTSPVLTQVVDPDPTSVTIAPSTSSAEPGQPVTYTATVTSPAAGTPTGTLSFTDDGSPIAGCQSLALPPSAPFQVTCTESAGSIATHSIVADFSGDTHFTAASAILAEPVTPMATTTSAVVSPPAPTYGQSVTLTATVAPLSGATDPTGTVTFSVNGTSLGSSMLSTAGGATTASMLVTTLPVGSDFVTATYAGATGFLASSAAAAHMLVGRTLTSMDVLTSGSPSLTSQPVTFTATMFPASGSGETGVVTFFSHGIAIGTSSVSNGQATLSTTGLQPGTDPITASYGGDPDFVGSVTQAVLDQVVNPAAP